MEQAILSSHYASGAKALFVRWPDCMSSAKVRQNIEYVSALALGWPVKPVKAEATYEHGLLRIEVPFKDPMEDAVKVAIKASGSETKAIK